jgi:hypothetical protein
LDQSNTNACVATEKATEAGNETFSSIIGEAGLGNRKADQYFYSLLSHK